MLRTIIHCFFPIHPMLRETLRILFKLLIIYKSAHIYCFEFAKNIISSYDWSIIRILLGTDRYNTLSTLTKMRR